MFIVKKYCFKKKMFIKNNKSLEVKFNYFVTKKSIKYLKMDFKVIL